MAEDLRSRIERLIVAGDRLLLDTSVFVSYFSGGDRWADASRELIEGLVRTGRNQAVVSALTVMESLVGPMRRVPPGHQTALDFYAHWPNLTVLPVDLAIAQEGASIRAHHGFAGRTDGDADPHRDGRDDGHRTGVDRARARGGAARAATGPAPAAAARRPACARARLVPR